MCGIAGIVTTNPSKSSSDPLHRMIESLAHRGPDAQNIWSSSDHRVHLGHRRLSIIDLSAAGNQPMPSHCGRYQLAYNGELYNHLDIRSELEGELNTPNWRGNSDTETLLAAIAHWGFEKALSRFNGMFAIALWDQEQQRLFLARDRLGEKPLYYGWIDDTFLFGSELKALKLHPKWRNDLDQNSLSVFFQYSSIAAPRTAYKNIFKLPPATYVCVSSHSCELNEPTVYWRLPDGDSYNTNSPKPSELRTLSDEEHISRLEISLADSVSRRSIADVPLGAFLSGGIDSSLIVALMQRDSTRKVKTFTIGFQEQEYNEAPYAMQVAKHLSTEHTELYVSEQQALDLVPRLAGIYDEPFADSSQIPTLLLAQMTREHVTVSLSGDGGDELFYGYARYREAERIWKQLHRVPTPLRISMTFLIHKFGHGIVNKIRGGENSTLNKIDQHVRRALKIQPLLASKNFHELYKNMLISMPETVLLAHDTAPINAIPNALEVHEETDPKRWMMRTDMNHYLHDTVLTKVDRATMAYGLESRAPFLDHNLVEYAWSLPNHLKQRNGKGKWILQELLGKYVPKPLFDRPKVGFGVPINHWLRSSLKGWATDLLADDLVKRQGLLDHHSVTSLLNDHLSGKADNSFQLWNLLMFQSWLQEQ